MSRGEYEIGASIPVQVGKGKMEKGKDNTEITAESAKVRNERYGCLEIIAENNRAPEKVKDDEGR